MANCCKSCMVRTPHATVIATILCLAGAGVFCATFFRGIALCKLMFENVFHFRLEWLQSVQVGFVIAGAVTGAVGLMILFVGVLTTGETRSVVYRAWQAQVGGRISCAVFIIITYLLQLTWLGMFGILTVVTASFSICWSMCSNLKQPYDPFNCIDFSQLRFLFPENTRIEDMKICEAHEIKPFCKDYVEHCQIYFFIATIAVGVLIMSLAHYLMSLSANYAHIRDHKKLKDYQDLYYRSEEQERATLAGRDRYVDESKLYIND